MVLEYQRTSPEVVRAEEDAMITGLPITADEIAAIQQRHPRLLDANVNREVAAAIAALVAERWAEREEAWQDASGLERGGDPGGVTPEDLRRHQEKREAAVQALVEAAETVRDLHVRDYPARWLIAIAALRAALDGVER